ncbi:hypothetical protein D1164_04280 [Mariniphaga sediminis]|uniref:Uncharacterized protein n=1 Tax=Mariniphaga sediminis TaxID=1628158 RepID=A0A399D8Q8_9BACT|nr:hypothetical protein D1164_04280 [Mariniphaga sediminis]
MGTQKIVAGKLKFRWGREKLRRGGSFSTGSMKFSVGESQIPQGRLKSAICRDLYVAFFKFVLLFPVHILAIFANYPGLSPLLALICDQCPGLKNKYFSGFSYFIHPFFQVGVA